MISLEHCQCVYKCSGVKLLQFFVDVSLECNWLRRPIHADNVTYLEMGGRMEFLYSKTIRLTNCLSIQSSKSEICAYYSLFPFTSSKICTFSLLQYLQLSNVAIKHCRGCNYVHTISETIGQSIEIKIDK